MKKSSGILLFRKKKELEFFLVHPGGPFWSKKDHGTWSIPKGEFDDTEDPLEAAKREFEEETGLSCRGAFIPLTPRKQKSGKLVYAWGLEMDIDPVAIRSNTFLLEWPPRSGQLQRYPEIGKGGWFKLQDAESKIIGAQFGFIQELIEVIST